MIDCLIDFLFISFPSSISLKKGVTISDEGFA